MTEKTMNEKLAAGKWTQETKNLEKEYVRDHFPEKSYEDDLDETDQAERVQEEIRHSNHRF
jgi:hypothetical protein